MKSFFLSVAAAFLGGLLLMAAFLLAGAGLERGRYDVQAPAGATRRVDPNAMVHVVQHARVDGAQRFTVQGVVQNMTAQEWSLVELVLTLRAGGAKVNTCAGMLLYPFAPRARQPFQITCEDADGVGLPADVTYEITIKSVT